MESLRSLGSKLYQYQSFLLYCCFLLLSNIYFMGWYTYAEPFPDRDSIHQIFFPFLNCLKTGGEISWNPLFLKGVLNEAYPWGLALICSSISILGLDSFFLQYPWFLATIFLIPLCLIPFWLTHKRPLQIFIFACLCFFPTIHIALKSFSYHGFIVLIGISAYVGFSNWIKTAKTSRLFIVIGLLFLGAILKHLGLFFLVSLVYTYFLWKLIRQESIKKELLLTLAGILCILIFYPINGLKVYLKVAFSHSPTLDAGLFGLGVLIVGLCIFAYAVKLGRNPVQGHLPALFQSGTLLLVFSTVAILTIAWEPPHDFSIHYVTLCLFLGYGFLFYWLKHFDFKGERGFVYLVIMVSMVHGTILYYSFIGQVSALFFLPITLAYLQFILEQPSRPKRVLSLLVIFLISNFSPGIQVLEEYLDDYGHHLYSRGLNGMHQNPLGWQNSDFTRSRVQITNILSEIHFVKDSPVLPVLFSNLHPHTRIQLSYPPSLTINLPAFKPLKHMDKYFLTEVREQVANIGLKAIEDEKFTVLFPILIRGLGKWSRFEFQTYSCEETMDSLAFYELSPAEGQKKLDLFQDVFGMRLNDCMIQYWQDNQILHRDFQRYLIPESSPAVELWVHKGLDRQEKGHRFDLERLEELKQQFQFYLDLTWSEKISFQGAPKTVRAAKLFKKSNDAMEEKRWQEAQVYMEEALKLVPDHQEMQVDLEIIKKELQNVTKTPAVLPYTILFKQANDEMEKKNWKRAEALLLQALKLEPNHQEMLLDLGIVRAAFQQSISSSASTSE